MNRIILCIGCFFACVLSAIANAVSSTTVEEYVASTNQAWDKPALPWQVFADSGKDQHYRQLLHKQQEILTHCVQEDPVINTAPSDELLGITEELLLLYLFLIEPTDGNVPLACAIETDLAGIQKLKRQYVRLLRSDPLEARQEELTAVDFIIIGSSEPTRRWKGYNLLQHWKLNLHRLNSSTPVGYTLNFGMGNNIFAKFNLQDAWQRGVRGMVTCERKGDPLRAIISFSGVLSVSAYSDEIPFSTQGLALRYARRLRVREGERMNLIEYSPLTSKPSPEELTDGYFKDSLLWRGVPFWREREDIDKSPHLPAVADIENRPMCGGVWVSLENPHSHRPAVTNFPPTSRSPAAADVVAIDPPIATADDVTDYLTSSNEVWLKPLLKDQSIRYSARGHENRRNSAYTLKKVQTALSVAVLQEKAQENQTSMLDVYNAADELLCLYLFLIDADLKSNQPLREAIKADLRQIYKLKRDYQF